MRWIALKLQSAIAPTIVALLVPLAALAQVMISGGGGPSLSAANTWTAPQTFSGIVPSNKAVYQNGATCLALGQAGSQGLAIIADNAAHRITGDLTILAWIRPWKVPVGSEYGIICLRDDDSGSSMPWNFYTYETGLLKGHLGAVQLTSSQTLPVQQWNQVALVNDADTGQYLYMNGTEVANAAGALTLPTSTGFTTRIGCWKSGQPQFTAQADIGEIAIFNTVLSPAQIAAYRTGQIPTNAPGLVSLYRLNATSGTTITDSAATGADGTISNAYGWVPRVNQ
ncbi:MAG: LamG domain-containing protein [Candidatus Obscuribacterales bacterium]|nr:LamG domain-containing protein [Candidatus Obscuribacterales bacterium]